MANGLWQLHEKDETLVYYGAAIGYRPKAIVKRI
jgi:hypothetical protein